MNGLSPWAASAAIELGAVPLKPFYKVKTGAFEFTVFLKNDSLWIRTSCPNGGLVCFRAAFAPSGLELKSKTEHERGIDLTLSSSIGRLKVSINITSASQPLLRYTTSVKPDKNLTMPYWPRDIIFPGKDDNAEDTSGKIHVQQIGTRSGLLYLSMTRPKSASIVYLQNLTALADYCEQTRTSCAEVVGGQWPELGLALPPAQDKPLMAAREVILSDAFVAFDPEFPATEPAMIQQYLNLLAAVYLALPKPDTKYMDWPEILQKGLKDLIGSPGCWAQVDGHHYFNAYVSDYTTPPEIMVQLAVLLPLLDYVEWNKTELEVMKTIKAGLPAFYDKKMGSIVRWLPAAQDKLEGEEEQKQPGVMDSWYLHHPMLNLSRLALKGDQIAKQLFMDSLEYTIKVAHHFKYQWPVFYKMDTFEVVKAETAPGKGGEKDVAGIYAHVMLQAYELTKEKRYLNEAEKAAKTLQGLGFDIFYQANNTAFSAGALLRLYKITSNQLYFDLSYMCLASVFKNVQLWDCNYGFGKHFPTFFALFPLSDAPYTAVYEEQEVFCAFHDYLKHAEGVDLLPSVKLLIAEFIRYLVARAAYYYPPMLPKEMLEEKPKVGELDPSLWIALEDLHDGWEPSGSVGQEVYGAGNTFGILPRHYLLVPGEDFMVYTDYPTSGFTAVKGADIHFRILGTATLQCRLMLIKTTKSKLPEFNITIQGSKNGLKGKKVKNGNIEFQVSGDQQVSLSWKKSRTNKANPKI